MTEFGKSPLLTSDELESLGYAAVIYPVTLLRVAMKAAEAALGILAADGTQREILDLMQTRQELYDLLEYDDYQERDRKHRDHRLVCFTLFRVRPKPEVLSELIVATKAFPFDENLRRLIVAVLFLIRFVSIHGLEMVIFHLESVST